MSQESYTDRQEIPEDVSIGEEAKAGKGCMIDSNKEVVLQKELE